MLLCDCQLIQRFKKELEMWKMLRSRYAGVHETLVAADVLRPIFPEFSEFVANIGSTGNSIYLNGGMELKVVHYADWRVQFTTIIPFRDRLQYLKDTYLPRHPDKGDAWWEAAVQKELELEHEIFRHLPYGPDDLARVVGERTRPNL